MPTIDNLRATSILDAYRAAMQRIVFLCFSGGDLKEVEREAISATEFELAVQAAQSDHEVEALIAQRDGS